MDKTEKTRNQPKLSQAEIIINYVPTKHIIILCTAYLGF